eukprot:5198878-Heterocapsa_arctica.AAC.1
MHGLYLPESDTPSFVLVLNCSPFDAASRVPYIDFSSNAHCPGVSSPGGSSMYTSRLAGEWKCALL